MPQNNDLTLTPMINGHLQPDDPFTNGDVKSSHEKISRKGWIVQKFGGTSVGKFPSQIAEHIVRESLREHRVAVVCSARSTSSKTEGTTNRLLRAAQFASKRHPTQPASIVKAILDDHVTAATSYISSPAHRASFMAEVESECADLTQLLAYIHRSREVNASTQNMIIARGESLSSRFMAALLNSLGVRARFIDLSEVVSPDEDQEIGESFYGRLASLFAEKITEGGLEEGVVPVLTGYFGTVRDGLLEKIGRGYTDLCAALVAVGIEAEELQVWKEVDGIFDADPRRVPAARLLPSITPGEAAELTFYGSEVIHPFTMEQVIRARIPIRIKNVMNPRNAGTIILPDPGTPSATPLKHGTPPYIHSRSSSHQALPTDQLPKRPTAVTIKHSILVVSVHSNKRTLVHDFFAGIFATFSKWRLSVDLISTSEVHVSMALHSESAQLSGSNAEEEKEIENRDLRGAIEELWRYGTVDVVHGKAILSLVGRHMKHSPGIAGKMFTVLGEYNVNIEMISQGASELNISCVIDERDAHRALTVVHTNLIIYSH